ncbi:MAG: radical SAM protein [Bacilli bacterium]
MKFKKVYVEITNICNKSCTFCSVSKRPKEEMSLELFKKTLEEIKNYTNYIYLHIKGEPLLHSKFEEIIQVCDKSNINVNITTNGSLIEKYIDVISKSSSIRQINISLHSYSDIDEIKKLFHFVDLIMKNNNNIFIVYRYWTYSSKDKVFEKLTNIISEWYKLDENSILNLKNMMNFKIDNNLYINKDFEFEWPSIENESYNEFGFCNGLKTHIGILSNGTVVPCCLDAEGIISLGNIKNNDLKEIIESEKTQKIIKNFKDNKRVEELCKHCSFKN